MYAVFVDDTPHDLDKVVKCAPRGKFETVKGLSTPSDLRALLKKVKRGNAEEPALILLDMAIGDDGEAGLKMLQYVRKAIPHMPVIIVSATKVRTLVTASFKLGASSYIHKTINDETFGSRIIEMFVFFSETSRLPQML